MALSRSIPAAESESKSKPRALLFNPENDLALASGAAHYSPPQAVAQFREECALLPAWVARNGDTVVAPGCEPAQARWLNSRFGLEVDINASGSGYCPSPWGWSHDVSGRFQRLGYTGMPDSAALERLRSLSHRHTAIQCRRWLGEEPGAEATQESEIMAFLDANHGCAYAKSPWSCSGRGVVKVDSRNLHRLMPALMGIVRRQGCVTLEPAYAGVLDCAALFRVDSKGVEHVGWSVFKSDSTGRYGGNLLGSQPQLERIITQAMDSPGKLAEVVESLRGFIRRELAPYYAGPVGVDMLVDADGRLHPCIEINLRATMGFVAMAVWERLGLPGLLTTTPGSEGRPLLPSGRLRLVNEPNRPGNC